MSRGKRRVRRSAEEWRRIIEQLGSSGLSQTAFCRQQGVSEGSLIRWRRKVGGEVDSARGFVEWRPVAATASLEPGEMELTLPGGVRLRLRA